MTQFVLTSDKIVREASRLGAEYVGFIPVDEWEQKQDVPAEFFPVHIWPPARQVIVLAVHFELPGQITPDSAGWVQAQSRVTNELLDEIAYRLAVFINRSGYPSVNIPQDSSGENLADQPTAETFFHGWAGDYAGLGKISGQGILVGKDGQRLNAVSVLTAFAETDARV